MHYRTKTLLTGAALTLLAVAAATGLGASKAAAASLHASAKLHKISACGYVAKAAGTYELTKSVTGSGSGDCIEIDGNNITLYLDGHTITGSGSDTCIDVTDSNGKQGVNQSVVGGSQKKPTMTATLSDCEWGVYVYYTSLTSASYLKIESPTSYGVYEEYSAAMTLSNIDVPLHTASAYGIEGEYGAGNVITKSTVDTNSSDSSFDFYEEAGDTVTHDRAMDTYSSGGNDGYGFYDYYGGRNTYSYDSAQGADDGFYIDSDGYGPVTLTHDNAVGSKTYDGGYGFYTYEAYQESDYASPNHTLVSHDKADGFNDGFYDDSADDYAVAEKFIDDTADNYAEYGFYIYYNTDYTMTGNIADMNPKGKSYDGSSTSYGFYLFYPESYYPFKTFSNNQAYDSEYGFYSDQYAVAGKGNIAKRNKYASYLVEVND